ncbi:Gas vesicle protein K [Saccharopolyspora antimicrobica]|uniref:Gas vesicle protein GvpK n=1 Tax=Saccharopolyspora antimicrobica TaxID=455193 RepID=A0A1I5KY91_9PSEU|nr:gas vesicle protein K [Saccharopolyspora antimicrobica]RKT89089.1 gas vesicle protein GvpK [Saccharopolyspora antimicrobica]SFO89868.1 Gas vesicle protein K [Saccharopolyspora antimicrobica]
MTGSPAGDRRRSGAGRLPHRIETDSESVQRDLVRLVLTLVELVRQLMEKQALRRVESGELDDDQVEELGLALMKLAEGMRELRDRFDLSEKDLNLDLGPLGPLLPRD